MKQNLYNLIELQKVDCELQALDDLKGDLPQLVNKLKNELQEMKQSYEIQNQELEESKRSRLHLEGNLNELEEKQKKYQEQLYAVTTNREYDAITVEIDSIKEKVSEAETQIIELIDKEKILVEEVKKLSSEIELLEVRLQKSEQELNNKVKVTENEYNKWQMARTELISHIRKPILYQYERIRKVKGQTTVVEINKYACGGCYAAIPPQKVMEVRHMDQLLLCESCGRILVCKNEKAVVET